MHKPEREALGQLQHRLLNMAERQLDVVQNDLLMEAAVTIQDLQERLDTAESVCESLRLIDQWLPGGPWHSSFTEWKSIND